MLESIFNETAAISTAQHQICLIALPPDFQVGQARPLSLKKENRKVIKQKLKRKKEVYSFITYILIILRFFVYTRLLHE